ncbi:polymorphic toxin type 15 domain-containing protein [Paenibacillus chitinolyticus]|uniref:polymorphic toxin type 15 domain-containing protein n=1 Tax=Paenibacillus chitinolyticus TaxID=79263 RepID=UPI00366AC15B
MEEIDVKFKRNKKHDSEEFKRQLKDQQNGINELTVEEFIANRDRYLKDGRALEGDAAQKLARKKALQDKIDEFREEGLSYQEAEQKANEWIKDKAALHNPDQIAGGYPEKIDGLGDLGINSSIKKVKLIEHIYLITEFMGQIE